MTVTVATMVAMIVTGGTEMAVTGEMMTVMAVIVTAGRPPDTGDQAVLLLEEWPCQQVRGAWSTVAPLIIPAVRPGIARPVQVMSAFRGRTELSD